VETMLWKTPVLVRPGRHTTVTSTRSFITALHDPPARVPVCNFDMVKTSHHAVVLEASEDSVASLLEGHLFQPRVDMLPVLGALVLDGFHNGCPVFA